jgi:arabinan endo-1,5-alpha-L-arabinosidase
MSFFSGCVRTALGDLRVLLLASALVLAMVPLTTPTATAAVAPGSYTNPLKPRMANGRIVENCPDPSVLRGRGRYGDRWYMYCTSDPLNDRETSGPGGIVFHRLPTLVSRDLVHWRFVGSALPGRPTWAARGANLWAPDVVYSTRFRRYYLTYAVTDTVDRVSGEPGCQRDPAIGLATSRTPVGPWRHASSPVVLPRRTGPGCSFASTIDPDAVGDTVGTGGVLFFGGFRGGIQAQRFSLGPYRMTLSGARSSITSERYEAANVVARGGYYYLFASAGACCNGPLSGYGVLAGRSTRPLGPYTDREGNSLLAARSGGTPVLFGSGNRWVGPGHNSVFRDFGGQWWTSYHAIDAADPYFAGRPGFTRRPVLLDPVDWVGGWPSVRSGRGASTTPVRVPAAKPRQRSAYRPRAAPPDVLGPAIAEASDELDGETLDPRWTWVREPDASTYRLTGEALELQTSSGDLSGEGRAPVLYMPAPVGNYVVETAVRLDVPDTGSMPGHVRAGLVVYADDDRFVSLMHGAPGTIRLTELAKKVPAGDPRLPQQGIMSVGPPGDVTRLRLVHRRSGGHDLFTAYTRQDTRRWIRGGTWVYDGLGSTGRIGLAALGGAGFTASFDYVRAWTLR